MRALNRAVPLQAPCCGKLYPCRLCHDGVEEHRLDRFRVAEVQCARCRLLQKVRGGGGALPRGGAAAILGGGGRRSANGGVTPPPAAPAALRGLWQPFRGVLLRRVPPLRPRQEAVPLRRVRHLQVRPGAGGWSRRGSGGC